MTVYQKAYLILFNAITDAEEILAQLRQTLIDTQRRAEELYLEQEGEGGASRQPS